MTIDSVTLLAHFGLTPETLPKLTDGAENIAVSLPHDVPAGMLDASEHQRTMAYGNRVDAQRFAASRVLLRAVLSHYLGCAPATLAYSRQTHGKPILAAPYTDQLHFSLARRNGWCAIALCRNQPVGVDIEQVCDLPAMNDIAAMYFSTRDYKAFKQLHGVVKQQRFFERWTALEAAGKWLGLGLSEDREVARNQNARVTHEYPQDGWVIALAV